jgi:hypothetical protein
MDCSPGDAESVDAIGRFFAVALDRREGKATNADVDRARDDYLRIIDRRPARTENVDSPSSKELD